MRNVRFQRSLQLVACFAIVRAALGCSLIPSVETECSTTRPCAAGLRCDAPTSRCVPDDGMDLGTADQAGPKPECQKESECSAGLACVGGHCQSCSEHGQCELGICAYEAPASATLGPPRCLRDRILFVDHRDEGGTCKSGDGDTPSGALCTLAEALPRAASENRVIRLQPRSQPYGGLSAASLAGKSISLFGQGGAEGGGARLASGGGPIVSLSGAGSVLLLDGIDLDCGAGNSSAVSCTSGGQVRLLRGRIYGCSTAALRGNACTVAAHRNLFRDNRGGAVYLENGSSFHLSNNLLARNGATDANATIEIYSSSGRISFNTLVRNQAKSSTVGGISSVASSPSVLGNLLFENSKGDYGSPIYPMRDLVGNLIAPDPPKPDPVFVDLSLDNLRLVPEAAANQSCCRDATSFDESKDPAIDYYGQPRLRGLRSDVGAAEIQ